jgi:hypothetical protein
MLDGTGGSSEVQVAAACLVFCAVEQTFCLEAHQDGPSALLVLFETEEPAVAVSSSTGGEARGKRNTNCRRDKVCAS